MEIDIIGFEEEFGFTDIELEALEERSRFFKIETIIVKHSETELCLES